MIEKAILEIQSGQSLRSTASKYGMSEGGLRYRLKQIEKGEVNVKIGRPTAFNAETEKQLAECIGTMCKLGFSPTVPEILNLVSSYLKSNDITINSFPSGRPGKDWFYAFIKRNNLSLKKATMISSARKSATANPFIIYDFYEQLEEIVMSKKLKAEQIWNCDESGFPSDPAKCKVVSIKGSPAYKVTCGAGRENTTTLAACNAAGKALDPVIVFSGKNLQSTWRGDKALPNTMYGVSENGWMTTELFETWFSKFAAEVAVRPLLLLYDGHLTHVSLEVIERAIKEDIHIIKFPPHVTDKLQPLDVACFGPLKRLWEIELNSWVNEFGPRMPMRKANFVNKLGEIWYKGLSPENIKAGFRATGVFPVDKEKFPTSRLDSRLVKTYQNWLSAGRPKQVLEDLAIGASPKKSPRKVSPRKSTPKKSLPAKPFEVQDPFSNRDSESCHCWVSQKLGPVPCPAPLGKIWVPIWSLQESKKAASEGSANKSFEELVLEKMKGPPEKQVKKRRTVDLMTKIITDEEYVKAIKEKEEPPKKKVKGDKQKKKGSADHTTKHEEERTITKTMKICTDDAIPSGSRESVITSLKMLWEKLNPPASEDWIVGKWFGAIFIEKKKHVLYVGKATKRFLADSDGPAESIELDCLKPHFGSGKILEGIPDHLPRDLDIFKVSDIIAGPLDVNILRGNKWEVKEYDDVKRTFEQVTKFDREKEYRGIFRPNN